MTSIHSKCIPSVILIILLFLGGWGCSKHEASTGDNLVGTWRSEPQTIEMMGQFIIEYRFDRDRKVRVSLLSLGGEPKHEAIGSYNVGNDWIDFEGDVVQLVGNRLNYKWVNVQLILSEDDPTQPPLRLKKIDDAFNAAEQD